jgi:chromosome partitioning protein
MPVVAVINRKGGSGKSTLATHLAAYCAAAGLPVMLGDVDRQQSAQVWLKLRSRQALPKGSAIVGWVVDPRSVLRVPAGVSHVVLDTPGGMRGFELARVVMHADAILMPVCNSVFDRESAAECYAELLTLPRVASGRCKVAAVGMRVDSRTRAGAALAQWAHELGLPFIGVLREAQAYVRCVEHGLTLFDLPAERVQADLAQWQPILRWLEPVLHRAKPAADPARTPVRTDRGAAHAPASSPPARTPVAARSNGSGRSTTAARPPAAPILIEPPGSRTMSVRLGKLMDVLRIPRFLQRTP